MVQVTTDYHHWSTLDKKVLHPLQAILRDNVKLSLAS
jgi:hypothetical protein